MLSKIAEIFINCHTICLMMLVVYFFLLFSPIVASAVPASCEAYFSPKDHLAKRLVDLIHREKKSIKMAAYCLTHKEIANALVQAHERGVQVEVIVDPFAVKRRSSIHALLRGKVPLFVWDHELRSQTRTVNSRVGARPLMHDKFCVFGAEIVWTGSFNFTYDASNTHQENVVTLESKEIANKYLEQFADMKLYEARPYQEYVFLHPKKGTK